MYLKTNPGKNRGFSLVESMVVSAVGLIIFVALGYFSMFSARALATIMNYNDLNAKSRQALDTLTRDIRQAFQVKDYSSVNGITTLMLTDANNADLTYTYNVAAGTLNRTSGGATKILLKECDELKIDLFQRNTKPGTYDQYEASISNFSTTTKLIQVSWTCSRKLLWAKAQTESVQTAKIVIRR